MSFFHFPTLQKKRPLAKCAGASAEQGVLDAHTRNTDSRESAPPSLKEDPNGNKRINLHTKKEGSDQNALMWMQDKKRGAQTRSVHVAHEKASTGVTQSCASAVAFGQTLMAHETTNIEATPLCAAPVEKIPTQSKTTFVSKRPLAKFAGASAEQGVLDAQARSVLMAHEDTSIEATTLCAAPVEFRKRSRGFTLLEIILAMGILAMLAAAIYALSTAAIQSTSETLTEQFTMRRLEGFLQITRNAFLNLPANGRIILNSSNGNSIPDLNFENATGLFGLASLGGGTLVLSAQPSSDGSRTFSILRLPKNVQGSDLDHFYESASWVKLLPKVKKPHWSFFRDGEWVDEWPAGAGRPQLVRLEMEVLGINHSIESIFYVPPINAISLNRIPPVSIAPPQDGNPNASPFPPAHGGTGNSSSPPANNPNSPPRQ